LVVSQSSPPIRSLWASASAFSCGITQVNDFFRRTANKLAKAEDVLTFVIAGPTGEPIGFYTTSAHVIDYTELPDQFARNRPARGSIPAAHISMIGVGSRYQGREYGGDLLSNCLT
jgi:ribosomal protein S18 acetylase RimI-like enzyme